MSRGILAYIKRTTAKETSQVTGQRGNMVVHWQVGAMHFFEYQQFLSLLLDTFLAIFHTTN